MNFNFLHKTNIILEWLVFIFIFVSFYNVFLTNINLSRRFCDLSVKLSRKVNNQQCGYWFDLNIFSYVYWFFNLRLLISVRQTNIVVFLLMCTLINSVFTGADIFLCIIFLRWVKCYRMYVIKENVNCDFSSYFFFFFFSLYLNTIPKHYIVVIYIFLFKQIEYILKKLLQKKH